jgi:hypothetical protein
MRKVRTDVLEMVKDCTHFVLREGGSQRGEEVDTNLAY